MKDWRAPFLDFLEQGILPIDVTDALRLVWRTKCYRVLRGQLYCQSASEVLLQCVALKDGRKLLLDIHGGVCVHHVVLWALVGKAFWHGFYWPTTLADTQDLIRTYKGCRYYAKQSHLPT